MRKLLVLSLFVTGLPVVANAQPMREAREVRRVKESYTTKWVVRPSEEQKGDQRVTNAPETDIRAVSAANDRRRLRIDINLYAPVNRRMQVLYAFKIRYKGGVEDWFAYTPHNEQFLQITMKHGRITKNRVLVKERRGDWVEVGGTTISGVSVPNSRVTLFIDKDKHFAMRGKGTRKWVTAQFFTGYFQRGTGRIKGADSTIDVKLSYVR